ncbi:protein Hook homolog 3-like isoform X3 [Ruditapes philippinarum]|uniref:protein Hook homolog 3-like isoform X3 n=2 Tax=Ruditapes philippinarum TaxID=129788 RepID=UPI00295B2435|nr:protein Hook homolog 3-like isoform X3 [Ruditapes philippinarum]
MDKETLYESLSLWLDTFNLDSPHQSPEQLSDGIAMAKVLHQIAPDYFNEGWLNRIKTEDVTNWRLKVSNLKKILKGILEYNLEILGIQIHDFQMPDVNAIGEHSDHGELGRLLQLILGCAVNCTEKQEYIQRIMSMEESVQHVVMTAIQELMTKEITTDVDSEVGEQLKRTVEELNSAIEAKEELMQRCHELDLQVTVLVEEKQNLSLENEKLSERLNQAENLDDPSTPAGKRFQLIQHQLEQCQEENYKLESTKDDFRIKVEVLQKEINELKDKNSELLTQTEECRGLKDELDDLRQAAEQVVKYEVQIESYKRKMDELSDLRGQVKLLEDKNTKYMQENLELQEDIRKSGTVKQQLDVYKRQVHELQSKLTEETKRADKADFENKRVNEKVSTLMREKERVLIERDSLREMNEELRCRPVEHRIVTERDSLREVTEELKCTQAVNVGAGAGDDLSATSQMEMLSLPPEIKEKILRLEHENKMLKLKSSGDNDEQSQVIQTMLDDANSRKNELETEIRLANQKTMELEAQIEDLQEMAKSTVSNTEMIDLRKKLDEQVLLTQQKDKLIQKERDSILEVQKELTAQSEEVEKLRDKIEKKEEEKRVMEERYKKYFDKARSVINSLEAKSKSGNNYHDVQALKQQIQEKDKLIEQLQKDQEKSKNTFEQEEKMMVSAWYNLGIQLHRQAAIDRLENSQPGQAFLSRQRQAHLRGQPRIPNSHNNPSRHILKVTFC